MLERFFPSVSEKTGLSPGTIIHVGEKNEERTRLRFVQYSENVFNEHCDIPLESCPSKDALVPVSWLHMEGLEDPFFMEQFGKRYGLHSLVLEDIVNTGHRPKLEEIDDYVFVVLKAFGYDDQTLEVVPKQICILFTKEVLFSFQEGRHELFSYVDKRVRSNNGRIRRKTGDYLAYVLLDAVLDNYFEIFDKIGERVEQLEEEVLSNVSASSMNKIHDLKRELAVLKKSILPMREVVSQMQKLSSQFLDESNEKYFRDLYDHVVQLIDIVDVFRDVVGGIRDLYLAMVSNRMNEVIKVLTIIATIFIPLTFIAGVYGMNFRYMPGLEWHWGYLGVLGSMVVCAGFMGMYFRAKKWI